MFKLWQFWTASAVIVGFIILLGFGFTTDPKKVPSPLIGKKAPDFEITRLGTQDTLTLQQLRGKPVILNFWASWCVECRSEAHVLEEFYQKYGVEQQKIQVIGIAIQDTLEQSQAFAKHFGKTYFLALDTPSGSIALDYGIYGVPETYFIDAQGIIRFKKVGGVTPQLMEEQIQQLIESTPTST